VIHHEPITRGLEDARYLRGQLHRHRLQPCPEAGALIAELEQSLGLTLADLDTCFGPYPLFRAGRDNHTDLHRLLYALHQNLETHYLALCQRVVSAMIREPCYVQAIPTYRFGLPGNRWVGSFHRDSDFGHCAYELNAICALTSATGSAALHVQQDPNGYSYERLELAAGEVILFDHIDRLHGCARNRSGRSVASIDFRYVPLRFQSEAFTAAASSINTRTPLVPGAYFRSEPLQPQ